MIQTLNIKHFQSIHKYNIHYVDGMGMGDSQHTSMDVANSEDNFAIALGTVVSLWNTYRAILLQTAVR